MTTWNYRVIKRTCSQSKEIIYQIHKIYYHDSGSIDSWNHTPVEPLGVSESGLRNDIRSFLSAFQLPVLEEKFFNGRARLIPESTPEIGEDLQLDYANKTSRASGYIYQMLGNHLLLKNEPALRQAYDRVDQALADLHQIADGKQYAH